MGSEYRSWWRINDTDGGLGVLGHPVRSSGRVMSVTSYTWMRVYSAGVIPVVRYGLSGDSAMMQTS